MYEEDEINGACPPLCESDVKEVVDKWIDILKVPKLVGGYLREDEHYLNAVTEWKVDDASMKEKICFSRTFAILKSSLQGKSEKPIVSSPGSVTVNEKFSVPSKSGLKRAVLVDKADSSSNSEFLQIWDDSTLLKTYNLEELDIHQFVYTHGGWGVTMTWSQDETKLAYLAEKKVAKTKPFYTSAHSKSADEGVKVGEEYIYKQTWGEQLSEHYESVIVVLDVTSNVFKVLQLPEGHFPTDIQWIGSSYICGTSYFPAPVWRLGMLGFSNRESVIFTIQSNGDNFRMITEPGKISRSGRVSPDGKFLVWQERILDGAHERARSIHGINLKHGFPLDSSPKLIYSSAPKNEIPIYDDFQDNCWSLDSSTLFVLTPNEAKMVLLAIPIVSPEKVKKIQGITDLLSISKDYLLVSSSTTITGSSISLLSITEDFKPIPITLSKPILDFPVETSFISGEYSPPSIYLDPSGTLIKEKSIPLVVCPHGGPHCTFIDAMASHVALFLKLGFAVLQVNYVGSTGGKGDTADELLGKIGDRDVKDCQAIVEKVLKSRPCLNPDKVVAWGGSHAGFIIAHLTSQYPKVYKTGAVILCPVTDLATLVGTSDDTDWTYAEAGIEFPKVKTILPSVKDVHDAQKYIQASPIHNVEKVKAATLLILGRDDLRAPASQGLAYYRALKAHNKIAEVRMYPDVHSLVKLSTQLDMIIHSALWLKRYTR